MRFFFMDSKKGQLLALSLCWCFVQSVLLYLNGVNTQGESLRFIREANFLHEQGHFSSPVYFLYLSEIVLMYISQYVFSGYALVIIIQLLFNFIGLRMMYNYLSEICRPYIALLSCFLLIICIPYQLYNTFLYTESIFFSLTIIYTIFLLRKTSFKIVDIIKLCLFLVLLALTRPTGLFFIAATCVYLFWVTKGKWHSWIRYCMLLGVPVLGLLLINQVMKSGGGMDSIKPFSEGHVICDIPTRTISTDSFAHDAPLISLIQFIIRHPVEFLQLSLQKSITFFGLYRNYYSLPHNTILVLFFFPLYIGILIRFFWKKRQTAAKDYFIYSLILIFWMAVVFSCDEWHNRFFLTLTPFLIITNAIGFFSQKNHTDFKSGSFIER